MALDKIVVVALMNEAASRVGGEWGDNLRKYADYLENDSRFSGDVDSDGNFALRIAPQPLSHFDTEKFVTFSSKDGKFWRVWPEQKPKEAVKVDTWVQSSLFPEDE